MVKNVRIAIDERKNRDNYLATAGLSFTIGFILGMIFIFAMGKLNLLIKELIRILGI